MGIPLTIGVDMTDKSRRTKDINRRTVRGVAGFNIVQGRNVGCRWRAHKGDLIKSMAHLRRVEQGGLCAWMVIDRTSEKDVESCEYTQKVLMVIEL